MPTCKICTEPYRRPLVLPCGHTFCQICIVTWAEKDSHAEDTAKEKDQKPVDKKTHEEEGASGGVPKYKECKTVSCPTCRIEHPIPEGGPAFFTRNYDFPSSEDIICDWCEEAEATVKCQDCDEWLCHACRKRCHDIKKKNKKHVMVNLEEVDQDKMEIQYKLCRQHGKKVMELYCTVCEEPCCLTGGATIHKMHNCITIDKHHFNVCNDLKEEKKKLKNLLDKSEELGQIWKTYEQMRSSDKDLFLQEAEKRTGEIIQYTERKKFEAIKEAKKKKEDAIREAEKEEIKSIKLAEERLMNEVKEAEIQFNKILKSLNDYDESMLKESQKVLSQIDVEVSLIKVNIIEIDRQLHELTPGEMHAKKDVIAKLTSFKTTLDDIPEPTWESINITDRKGLGDCSVGEYLGTLDKIVIPPEPVLVAEINARVETDEQNCSLWDVVVMSDDVVAVADDKNGNIKIKLFNQDGQSVTETKPGDFNDPSWLVQNPTDQKYLLVANYSGSIQNVNSHTGQVRTLTTEVPRLRGISVTKYKNEVVVVVGKQCPKELILFNPKTWAIIKRFTLNESGYIQWIAGHAEHDVVAVRYILSNNHISLYKQAQLVCTVDQDVFQVPVAMCLMRNGWVLVADRKPPRIIVLSEAGQVLTTLLSKESDFNDSPAICYNETKQLLAVTGGNKVKIYRWSPGTLVALS